jgi:hypothetical protein
LRFGDQEVIKNAVIVTTRWDVVGNERAVDLEQELVTGRR